MPIGDGPCCVYTIYRKSDNKDVYIGATEHPDRRKSEHAYRFDWDVYEFVIIRRFQTREEMLAEEKELIKKYQPEFNIVYTDRANNKSCDPS
jgi:predicted GIY-YIG superfamily endonuclease